MYDKFKFEKVCLRVLQYIFNKDIIHFLTSDLHCKWTDVAIKFAFVST